MVNKSKNKLAIGCLLLGSTVIVSSIWGWRVFTGTPRYSLRQLKAVINKNEPNEIQKYVDVKAIASQMVDFSLQSVQQQALENNDVFGILGNSLGIGELLRPQLQQGMEQMLNQSLTQIPQRDRELELTSIERNETQAIATFALSPSSNKGSTLESVSLVLEQQPSRQWKIIGLGPGTLEAVSESIDR